MKPILPRQRPCSINKKVNGSFGHQGFVLKLIHLNATKVLSFA